MRLPHNIDTETIERLARECPDQSESATKLTQNYVYECVSARRTELSLSSRSRSECVCVLPWALVELIGGHESLLETVEASLEDYGDFINIAIRFAAHNDPGKDTFSVILSPNGPGL